MLSFDRRRKHLKGVIARIAADRIVAAGGNSAEAHRKAIQEKLKEVERKRAGRQRFDLRGALAMAGISRTPRQFLLVASCLGCVGGAAGLSLSPVLGVLGATAAGLGLPRFFLKYRTKRRLAQFTALFADSLDIIIRGVRSGLPIGECMNMIGYEMPDPMGSEFRMITEGVRLGMTIEEGLQRMSERVPTSEVRFLTIVIGIQQQTGGNLAETLSKLADVLRSRKRMRDKVQAMSSEAKASAGIIGSLPVFVSALLGFVAPEYISLLFTTSTGNWILAGCAMVMSFGVFVMRRMIAFEI
jgi:tight adherence protein B